MDISEGLRKEIERDIERCNGHSEVNGSESLIREIVAKYSRYDTNFAKEVCPVAKVTVPGYECDYRNELRSAAARLKTFLLDATDSLNDREERLACLISRIEDIKKEFTEMFGGIKTIYTSNVFIEWRENLKYLLREMTPDDTITELLLELDQFNGYDDEKIFYSVVAKCNLIHENSRKYFKKVNGDNVKKYGSDVFIIHGHDNEAKIIVARTVEQLGLRAVILHEKPDEGKTIIEKLEKYTSNAAYAIVLYTECDLGRDKNSPESCNQYRARQNVVFEHGLLIGAIGRERVTALVKGKVEKPGDIDGVIYTDMDDQDGWKIQLCKNMKAAGLDVDMNKLT